MRSAILVLLFSAAARAEEPPAETETFQKIEASDKLQRVALSSLMCAGNILRAVSKALVSKERRMARETVFVKPEALREARRLLEKADDWQLTAKRQLRDRKAKLMPCKLDAIAGLAACIALTETNEPECTNPEDRGAVKWALTEEE